jgi:hypothetical protein
VVPQHVLWFLPPSLGGIITIVLIQQMFTMIMVKINGAIYDVANDYFGLPNLDPSPHLRAGREDACC